MTNLFDLSQFSGKIQQSDIILIILNESPSFDEQLAAASLYLALKQHNKKASLLGVKKIDNPTISGLDQLKTDVANKNLVISFDYKEAAVHNVSYHIDDKNNKFHLTIKPQPGHDPLNKDAVNVEYAGADSDLVVLFGVERLDDLGQLYTGYENLYQDANLMSISDFQPNFSASHLDSSVFSSYSEAVFHLLKNAEISFNSEVATNLLAGIQHKTNNFIDPTASADTFEAVANLLRAGAHRKAGSFALNNADSRSKKTEKNEVMEADDEEFEKSIEQGIKEKIEEFQVNETSQEVDLKISDEAPKTKKDSLKKKSNFREKKSKQAVAPRPSGLKR